jgi:uncharacterized protein (DUF1330 family)
MPSIEPTPERFAALLGARDIPGTIVMINLLRFRQRAAYPPDFDATPCTGGDAYQRYAEVALQKVHAAGGRALWLGNVVLSVIAPEGEEWNEAVLVEYPSRRAFLDMIGDPEYRAATVHRTAALADSRLICTTTVMNAFAPRWEQVE